MNMANYCRFRGNLGRDPELSNISSGTQMAKVSMAVTMRRKEGDEWVDSTTWIPLVIFGVRAEAFAKYTQKGTQLDVVTRFETRSWEDEDGKTHYSYNFVIQDFDILSKGRRNGEASKDDESREERYEPVEDDFPF